MKRVLPLAMQKMGRMQRKGREIYFFITILALFMYFSSLSSFGLTEPDEPRYAEAAREMLELKSYLIPYYNYEPRLEKPPFFYWLIAASYKLFGVSEKAARIPSVVMALLCSLVLLIAFYEIGETDSGLKAFLIFLSMPYVFVISQLSITDMTLCFFITLSSYSFFLFMEKNSQNWRRIAYLSMALGFLTKGPVAFIIPIISDMLYALVAGRSIRKLFSIKEILLFLVVSIPWFIYILKLVGFGFFYKQTIGRYFKGVWHKRPFYFFIPYILAGAFPQIILFILGGRVKPSLASILKFSGIYAAFVFLFFSISKCKLPNYILPIFPPIAACVAIVSKERPFKIITSFCLMVFLVIKLFVLPTYASRLSIRPLFKGKNFEKNATFLFYKKPYKAYPFYVRKKVFRIDRPSEALSYQKPVYVLTKGLYLGDFSFLKFDVVSKSIFRDKDLFLLKIEP